MYKRTDDPETQLAAAHRREEEMRASRDTPWSVVAFIVLVAAMAAWVGSVAFHAMHAHR
jgi:hypothetical protein